jgi:hypothetical protein
MSLIIGTHIFNRGEGAFVGYEEGSLGWGVGIEGLRADKEGGAGRRTIRRR